MKKIFSIILVVSMLCAMALTANAAYSIGFEADKTTVKVGETFNVVLKVDLSDGDGFSGGSVYFDYDKSVATLDGVATGTMTEGVDPFYDAGTGKANKTFTTALTESGTFAVATFTATAPADAFVVKALTKSSFTFRPVGANAARKNGDFVTVATVKIEEEAPAGPVEERVNGAAIACDKTWEAPKSAGSENTNTYTSVAVATASAAAGAKEAGFKFVMDDVNNTPTSDFVVLADADGIDGEGTIEYTAVMYGVDYSRVTTMYALPYYLIMK